MAVTDCIRTCRYCGAEFRRTQKGQSTAYCAPECKAAAEAVYKREYDKKRPERTYSSRLYKRKLVEAHCAECHILFLSYRTQDKWTLYCSMKCAHKERGRKAIDKAFLRDINMVRFKAIVLPEILALRRIAGYVECPKITKLPCKYCGGLTIGKRKIQRVCKDCHGFRKVAQARRNRQSPAGRASRLRYKTLRRARLSIDAEAIDPMAVFDRDKWKCHLCGCVTPKQARGTYADNAPELDHVVPLALGGGHTWGNVQCLCRQCNGLKGATSKGQLSLPMAGACGKAAGAG